MIEVYAKLLFFLVVGVPLVCCYCPPNRIQNTGACSFRIHCIGTIRGVSLPDACRGSTNHPVTVDLTLSEAIERFDRHINRSEFLKSVTTLRTSANWPQTSLSFLEYMPLLKNLHLNGNRIKQIDGEPFYHLSRLQHIDLSHNSLSDVEDLFQFENQPNKLKKLILAYNDIHEIPGETFEELTSLVELDISHNFISNLNEEPFFNLTNLQVLRINNNNIKDLNGAVNNLHHLKHLYLRGNQIHNIDEPSLNIIFHLETFDVSGNQLDRLKPILFLRHWHHFGGDCNIILSENQITSIPNGTSKELVSRFTRDMKKHNVTVLTTVDLSKNAIENIEYNAFSSAFKLVSLDLSCNKLKDFIVNPADLTNVNFLNLSSNYLSTLYYESFSSMNYLYNLDLSHNSLDNIPDETFANNYNLKHVNLTHNVIKELDHLHIKIFHPEGGVLVLANNGLSRLQIPLGEGMRLTMLILRSNNISEAAFVNLIYQTELKVLEMRGNAIQKLNDSSLQLPISLTSLDLSYNQISEIGPSTFKRVSHLVSLYLGHNKLKSIEYGAFQGLTSLSHLDLSFNKIDKLNSKVLMDLKSLSVLSLRYNGLYNLDYTSWFNHKSNLLVHLEGNTYTCEWLAKALQDYNNGYSKMRPTAHLFSTNARNAKNSLEGISCVQRDKRAENLEDLRPRYMLADERLLISNQKIVEAVKDQTHYLRAFMNRFAPARLEF